MYRVVQIILSANKDTYLVWFYHKSILSINILNSRQTSANCNKECYAAMRLESSRTNKNYLYRQVQINTFLLNLIFCRLISSIISNLIRVVEHLGSRSCSCSVCHLISNVSLDEENNSDAHSSN